MNLYPNYVAIDLDAIEENFCQVQKKAGVPVMAVIKANAYGHGAVEVARLLGDRCAFFGVATVSEALELRRAGIQSPLLILGHTPVEAYPLIVGLGIRPTLFRYDEAQALSKEATARGLTVPFHFAVDTGMNRIGFRPTEEDADLCAKIAAMPGLEAEGLFSHFATADEEDLSRTHAQADAFDRFSQLLQDRGVCVKIRHLNNSAGIMNLQRQYDMVRSGIVLYGLYPSQQVSKEALPLTPALSWHSWVTHVKTLPPGQQISYGGTFETVRETVVATVPVGYADGYRRNLSNRFYVLISGKRAPILGRVCMDQMMVDVTDIPGVKTGTPVVLTGTDGNETISAEQIAAQGDSFNYEFVCSISRRVPRVYTRNGEVSHITDYLA